MAGKPLAVPLLYVEFSSAGNDGRDRVVGHKQITSGALKDALGTILRKGDLAAAGAGGQWFIVLLMEKARRRKTQIADADIGVASERLRKAVTRKLARVARTSRRDELSVRCGWSVLELDGVSSLHEALRQAIRGAAVVARVEERRGLMLAAVTHELRTPLAAIAGFAERLRNGELDTTKRERSVAIILDESRRLERLAQGLLDIGSWTSGHLQLGRRMRELRLIVARAIESLAERARSKNVKLVVSGRARASVDPDRALQICMNLLDNALRHAPPHSSVRARIVQRPREAEIVISDCGPGFASTARVAFGKPFSRGHNGQAGLGLAISKILIEAHGGQLAIANTQSGAQVTARFPK